MKHQTLRKKQPHKKQATRGATREQVQLEREARAAADLVNARRPVGALSAAAPAPLPRDIGPGHALNPATRTRLEQGFGTDLSGLRIHTGPQAAAAADAINARAFAAGPHLVFSDGSFRPHDASGLRLIAHETAHALQQGIGPAQRSAKPQRAPGDDDDTGSSPPDPADANLPDLWIAMRDYYKVAKTIGGKTPEPELADDIATMEAILGTGRLIYRVITPLSTRFATEIKGTEIQSFTGKCLAFDVMQMTGEDTAATEFLVANPALETIASMGVFRKHLNTVITGELMAQYYIDQPKTSPLAHKHYTELVTRLKTFITDPLAPSPEIGGLSAYLDQQNTISNDAFQKLKDGAPGPNRLNINPLQVIFLQRLKAIEETVLGRFRNRALREKQLKAWHMPEQTSLAASPYFEYLYRLDQLDLILNHPLDKKHTLEEPLRQRIEAQIGLHIKRYLRQAQHAMRAARFMLAVGHINAPLKFKDAAYKTTQVPALVDALSGLSALLNRSHADSVLALKPLSDPSLKALKSAAKAPESTPENRLELFHARLLDKKALETRRDTLADHFVSFKEALHTAFLTRPAPKASKDETMLTGSGTLLVALIWADAMEGWLRSLTVDESADSRADFRFSIAIHMRVAGVTFKHSGMRSVTYGVAVGSRLGESYAVVVNPYAATKKAYQDIASDFGSQNLVFTNMREVKRKAGKGKTKTVEKEESFEISPSNFVKLYNITEMREILGPLAGAIKQRKALANVRRTMTPIEERAHLEKLRKEGSSDLVDPEKEGEDALRSINDQLAPTLAGLSIPSHYEAKNSYLVMYPADAARPHEIQLRHPSATQFWETAYAAQKTGPESGDSYALRDDKHRDRVYFWFIPSLEPIWLEFQDIPDIKSVIDTWRKEEKVALGDEADVELIRFYDWARKKGHLSLITAKYDAHLITEQAKAEEKLKLEYRNMTTVNRMIAKDMMADAITVYGKGVNKFQLPTLFGKYIAGFSHVVLPGDERKEQIALLMLQTSPQIKDMLKRVDSYDSVRFLLPAVSLALSIISGKIMTQTDASQISADMAKARQDGIEATFKLLDSNYKTLDNDHARLIEIMTTLLKTRFSGQDKLMLVGGDDGGVFVTASDVHLAAHGPNSAFILSQWANRDVTDNSEGVWHWPTGATVEKPMAGEPPKGVTGTKSPYYYQIEEVAKPFQYVPTYAKETDKNRKHGKAYTIQGEREIDASEVLMVVRIAKVITVGEGKEEETKFENERIVQIRAGDEQLLDLMTSAVQIHTRAVEMAEFADNVQAGVGIVLDLLEFVPGVGPVIAAARLVKALIDIMRTLDWDELRQDFIEAPTDLLNLIREDFLAKLDGDMFWWFLLSPLTGKGKAGDLINALSMLKSRSKETQSKTRKSKTKGRNKGRLVRQFLDAIEAVGPTFVDGFMNLHTRATGGVDNALARVMMTPLLAAHLSRVDQYAEWMRLGFQAKDAAGALTPEFATIFGGKGNIGIDGALNNILNVDTAKAMGTSFHNMLSPITELELPEEVLPMDVVLEMVIELALGNVHNKKIRIVYDILQATGAISKISEFVAENLVPEGFDPNEIWKQQVVGVLQEPFQSGRNELVTALLSAVDAVFDFEPGAKVEVGKLPDFKVNTDAETPAAEPFLRAGDPRHPHPGLMPRDMGQPLSKTMREALQTGFGHDLSHIRLHDDPSANTFVAAAGAEALASGSHIYLGQNTDPGTSQGDHILRHEVSHVLQQTGPRPLLSGRSDTAEPSMGEPGRGITRHAGREEAADQMAIASKNHNASSDGPLPVRGSGPVSMAPFTQDDMIRILTELGEQARGADETYINRVTGGISGASNKLTTKGRRTLDQAKYLLGELQKDVQGTAVDWKTGWGVLDDDLKKGMQIAAQKGLMELKTGSTYKAIAARLATIKPKRKRRTGDEYNLNFQSYINVLSGYVYDTVGVRVNFNLIGDNHTDRVKITFAGVHLGRLDFNKARGLYSALKKNNDDDGKGFNFVKARAYYAARFPLPHDLNVVSRRLVLSKDERDAVRASSTSGKKLKKMEVDGKAINWKAYTDPNSDGLGLKVGTHGKLTTKGASDVAVPDPTQANPERVKHDRRTLYNTERESHHLPQFLLAEFYAGASKTSTAVSVYGTNGDYWTPGFTGGSGPAGKRPSKAEPVTGFKGAGATIKFDPLIAGSKRGAGMPAISLARDTHRKGSLHLNKSTEWNPAGNDDANSTKMQSATMINMHRLEIIKAMTKRKSALGVGKTGTPRADFQSRSGFKKIVDHALLDSERTKTAEEATLEAMRGTYFKFVRHMLPPLKSALSTIEKPYYARVATNTPGTMTTGAAPELLPAFTPKTGDAWQIPILNQLKDHNRRIYGAWFQDSAWS